MASGSPNPAARETRE